MPNKKCKDLFEKWIESGTVENKLAIVHIAIIYALKVYGGDFFNDRKILKANVNESSVSVQPQVQLYLPQQTDGDQNDKKQ